MGMQSDRKTVPRIPRTFAYSRTFRPHILKVRDGRIYHAKQTFVPDNPNTPWGPWSQIGTITGFTSVDSDGWHDGSTGYLHVLAVGYGRLHHAFRSGENSGQWTGFADLNAPSDGEVIDAAIAVRAGPYICPSVHACVLLSTGQVYHTSNPSWDATAPWEPWRPLPRGDAGDRQLENIDIALAYRANGSIYDLHVCAYAENFPDHFFFHQEYDSLTTWTGFGRFHAPDPYMFSAQMCLGAHTEDVTGETRSNLNVFIFSGGGSRILHLVKRPDGWTPVGKPIGAGAGEPGPVSAGAADAARYSVTFLIRDQGLVKDEFRKTIRNQAGFWTRFETIPTQP